MRCSSFFTFTFSLGNAVATLTIAGGGVSSSVSTSNHEVLPPPSIRFPDEHPNTVFVFDYRPPGVIQGCRGFICYDSYGKESELPGETFDPIDLKPWKRIRDGYREWKKRHPEEDAYIYMVDQDNFSPSKSDVENLYSNVNNSNIRGWAPLGKDVVYHGLLIGGYIENPLYKKPMVPRKKLERCLAMKKPEPKQF
ncbi:hypothetical protein PpBr36_03303 [Pyricularia pennisetigena]|uniref:hypothetical protein n=1 Tax=Pyricularia pennisetigena TaxID=1578925 RepID=UPI001152FBD4|nr:hypothetical protein PpBr36_03303 [Pyricularia pennisetigena]TLS30791.1 hypothetical protein PpBr36_03303 [Pyricularia pennisetigena]